MNIQINDFEEFFAAMLFIVWYVLIFASADYVSVSVYSFLVLSPS